MEEFCEDLLKINDFQKSTVRLLAAGEVDAGTINHILDNLCDVVRQEHLKLLLQLACLLYDFMTIEDELIFKLQKKGIPNIEITNLSSIVPNTVSRKLARMFFKAFEKAKIRPLDFKSALYSENFAKYCANFETEKAKDMLIGWRESDWFNGAFVYNSADCAIRLFDTSDSDSSKSLFRWVLKEWWYDGSLRRNIAEGPTWEGIKRIYHWNGGGTGFS